MQKGISPNTGKSSRLESDVVSVERGVCKQFCCCGLFLTGRNTLDRCRCMGVVLDMDRLVVS